MASVAPILLLENRQNGDESAQIENLDSKVLDFVFRKGREEAREGGSEGGREGRSEGGSEE